MLWGATGALRSRRRAVGPPCLPWRARSQQHGVHRRVQPALTAAADPNRRWGRGEPEARVRVPAGVAQHARSLCSPRGVRVVRPRCDATDAGRADAGSERGATSVVRCSPSASCPRSNPCLSYAQFEYSTDVRGTRLLGSLASSRRGSLPQATSQQFPLRPPPQLARSDGFDLRSPSRPFPSVVPGGRSHRPSGLPVRASG